MRYEELGVKFLDTAPMYGHGADGRSERVCGQALRGRRDQWIVSSKFGRSLALEDDDEANIVGDYSSQKAIASIETSLRRLQTD